MDTREEMNDQAVEALVEALSAPRKKFDLNELADTTKEPDLEAHPFLRRLFWNVEQAEKESAVFNTRMEALEVELAEKIAHESNESSQR